MPGKNEDVSFGFDPAPFKKGLDSVAESLGGLQRTTDTVAKGMGKSMFWAMAKVEALVGAAKMVGNGIKNAIGQNLPEIGRTFEIAKEIMLKNLFWPLRQTLAPYLQKLLDWVRDNRVMFIKWGEVLANAFKVAVGFAGSLWNALRGVQHALGPILGAFFGTNTIDQAVNLMLLKIAVVGEFVGRAFNKLTGIIVPLVQPIVDIAKALAGTVWDAATGFFKALGNIDVGGALLELFNAMKAVVTAPQLHDLVVALASLAGTIAKDAWIIVTNFFRGFKDSAIGEGLAKAAISVTKLSEALSRLLGSKNTQSALASIAATLGQFAGNAVSIGLQAVASAIDLITAAIRALNGEKVDWGKIFGGMDQLANKALDLITGNLGKAFSFTNSSLAGDWASKMAPNLSINSSVPDILKHIGDQQKLYDYAMAFNKKYGRMPEVVPQGFATEPIDKLVSENVKDAVITKEGRVIRTDPQDDIFARKRAQGSIAEAFAPSRSPAPSRGPVNVRFEANVTVTEGNARKAGEGFVGGMNLALRKLLMDDLVLEGAR